MTRLKVTRTQATLYLLVICASPAGAQEPCGTTGPTTDAIREVFAEIDTAFATADAALFPSLVTEETLWMPPEEPQIRGRAAVEARYRALFTELHDTFSEVRHEMHVAEVCVFGDWAMSRGSYRLTLTLPHVPEPIVITGKNVHTFRQQGDGNWLIASDIWNTDAPLRRGPPQ